MKRHGWRFGWCKHSDSGSCLPSTYRLNSLYPWDLPQIHISFSTLISVPHNCSLIISTSLACSTTFFCCRIYLLSDCSFFDRPMRAQSISQPHSTLFSDVAPLHGAIDKTSSHIFLSRGVAEAQAEPAPCSRSASPALVASIFESASTHIMTVGDAASSSVIGSLDSEASSFHRLGSQCMRSSIKSVSTYSFCFRRQR